MLSNVPIRITSNPLLCKGRTSSSDIERNVACNTSFGKCDGDFELQYIRTAILQCRGCVTMSLLSHQRSAIVFAPALSQRSNWEIRAINVLDGLDVFHTVPILLIESWVLVLSAKKRCRAVSSMQLLSHQREAPSEPIPVAPIVTPIERSTESL